LATEPATEPLISDKLRAAFEKRVRELLEPDESLVYAVPNLTMPVWVYLLSITIIGAIAILPYAIQNASTAVVTQRHVYVFKTNWLGRAKRPLIKAPLGTVESSVGGSAFPGRYLLIGEEKIWLPFPNRIRRRAEAMSEAASTGLEALPPGDVAAAAREPETT
jgi:hypothetical protein